MAHWYRSNGETCYEVERSDGKGVRDTDLRDARKLGLYYSTTSVIGQIAKPQLEKWKLDQLLDTILYLQRSKKKKDEPYIKTPDIDIDTQPFVAQDWQKQVLSIYKDRTSVYSARGTVVHDKMETFYLDGTVEPEDEEMLWPAIQAVNELGYDLAYPEKSFASPHGYGGKIDLILAKGEDCAIIDFKTKQGADLGKKSLYNDYLMQLAAYREAINPNARCFNLLISVTNPGIAYLHEWTDEELKKGWAMFKCLLDYTKLVNNYDPCKVTV